MTRIEHRHDATPFLPDRMSLKSLREAAATCRGCHLYATATQTVFGEGLKRARLMLVGEMPGDREDRAGRVFVGPAGRELDKALERVGIVRADVYITNVVKHFKFEERGKRRIHQKPKKSEVDACIPWLRAELSVVRPEALVLLGATAAQALLGSGFRLTQARGHPVESGLADFVTATVHPSAILRAPDDETRHAERRAFTQRPPGRGRLLRPAHRLKPPACAGTSTACRAMTPRHPGWPAIVRLQANRRRRRCDLTIRRRPADSHPHRHSDPVRTSCNSTLDPYARDTRRRLCLAALGVALLATLLLATSASATPLLGSNFDSQDGDQLPTALAPVVKDWQSVAPADLLTVNVDPLRVDTTVIPNKRYDGCFIGGVKEDSPNDWAFNETEDGCTPGKSDLLGMWSHAELTPANSFLHAAFIRRAPSGNTFITFELNRVGASWTNGAGASIPCRSDGDLLLSYEVGGSSVSVSIYRWTGDGTGPAGCPNGANGTFTSSSALNNGSINAATITNYLSPATITSLLGKLPGDTTVEANLFGEAQIDISAMLASMGIGGCYSYVSAQAHSRSSSSISSALIDFVPPTPTAVANCAVAGTVYSDADSDAVQDAGEAGMAGRTAFVDVDGNGALDAGEPSAITDAQGYYVIPTGFTSGTYAVRVVVPGGYVCTAPAVTCANNATFTASGTNDTSNDFGLLAPASVSGTAYEDTDGDAVRDGAETTPVAGRTVFDDVDDNGAFDAGEPSTMTAADGTYTLDGLQPGTHRIRLAPGAGWVCDGPAGCLYTVTTASGDVVSGDDFLAYERPTVAGVVYSDANANAIQNAGDGGRQGVVVGLYASDGTTLLAGAVTDATGSYAFAAANWAAAQPGAYVVRVSAPVGNVCSGSCDTAVALSSGENLTGQDTGVYADATVTGAVFTDDNANGVMDGSETGVASATVYDDANDNGSLDAGETSTLTAGDGGYSLSLAPGGAHIRTILSGADVCTGPSPCRYDLTLSSADTVGARDFGIYTPSQVAGAVYADADGDGTRDAGEAGEATQTVFADYDGDGTLDAGEPSTATALDGSYTLTGIRPGTFAVRALVSGAEACTAPANCTVALGFSSGSSLVDRDFGIWTPASVAGTVYEDDDADGARAGGEAGLAGRTVYADANDNDTLDAGETSDVTAADGSYSLAGLSPGTYAVRVVAAGWTCSAPAACEHALTLASGQTATGEDFGLYTSAVISGRVTDDSDGDGSAAAGEPGLQGRTVWVDVDGGGDHDAGEPSTTTDANGDYTLPGVDPGTYTVRVELPSGWSCSPDCSAAVTVGSGDTPSVPFNQYADAQLSGTVYDDADESGARSAGEGGLDGLTVSLDAGADDTVDATTTTAVDGSYTFSGLRPGSYRVTVTAPAGWACTAPSPCRFDRTATSGAASSADDFGLFRAAVADLSLVKTAPATVDQDEQFDYTLGVQNAGPDTATDAVVTDDLPAGVQFVSADAGCGELAGTVTCQLGDVASGATAVRTITVRAVDAGDVANSATVSSATGDPTPANDSATANTTVAPVADLRLAKTADRSALLRDDQVTYTLTVVNDGPSDAPNVSVTDTLPAGAQFVSASAGCTGTSTVLCDLGTIADGASSSVTITVTAIAEGDLLNTATVASGITDPDPADDSASVTVLVGPTTDLSIVKTGPATVAAGGQLTYTLTARNDGPSAATGVVVTDQLPAGMTYVGSAASQGGCSVSGGDVTCALGGLANGATATVTVTAQAAFALAGQTVPNTAAIAGDQSDGDPGDDVSTHDVDVGPAADLVFTKDAPAHVPAGGRLLYSLQVTNDGPQTATAVELTDTLPDGVTFVSAVPTQGSCSAVGQSVTCAVGDLPPGAGAQVLLTTAIAPRLAGTSVRNEAAAASDTPDAGPSSNGDDATTAVDAVAAVLGDLSVTKTADAEARALLGQPVAFTIRVVNESDRTAHGVVAVDQPSAAVTVESVRPERGSCTGLTCRIGDMAPGEVVLIAVVMTPQQTGTLSNSVVVHSDDGDSASGDNTDGADIQVDAVPATLRLRKTADKRSVPAGKSTWFTITATNTATTAASVVRVCDVPAANTAFVTVKGARFSKGRACWTTTMLAAGEKVSFRVKMRVAGNSRAARFINRATVTSANAQSRRAHRAVRVIARHFTRGGGVTG